MLLCIIKVFKLDLTLSCTLPPDVDIVIAVIRRRGEKISHVNCILPKKKTEATKKCRKSIKKYFLIKIFKGS